MNLSAHKSKIDFNYIKPRTFWDCDFNKLDPVRDLSFIVFRTLLKGSDDEINYIHSLFSVEEIFNILSEWKEKDPIMLNYYKTLQDYENSYFKRVR
ncbi:MAG: hypothetical protein Q4G27_00430 [Flavobacteriaceae bacterium]|nr:hypothetical protein [Flavobacteriaceae bacterium]